MINREQIANKVKELEREYQVLDAQFSRLCRQMGDVKRAIEENRDLLIVDNAAQPSDELLMRDLRELAFILGTPVERLITADRRGVLVSGRHVAIGALKTLHPRASLNQLGRVLHRDHATIHHSITKARPLAVSALVTRFRLVRGAGNGRETGRSRPEAGLNAPARVPEHAGAVEGA